MQPHKSYTVRAVQDSFFSRCVNKLNSITSERILPVPATNFAGCFCFPLEEFTLWLAMCSLLEVGQESSSSES